MKVLRYIVALCMFSGGITNTAWAAINFGSQNAGFIVPTGATVDFAGCDLVEGTVYVNGGSIASTTSACTGLTVESRDGSSFSTAVVTGAYNFSNTLQLGDNDRLVVDGGFVDPQVTVVAGTANPAVIQGYGEFDNNINLGSGAYGLSIGWTSTMNVAINMAHASSEVTLLNDLTFASAKGFGTGLGTVYFNGYRVTLGGSATDQTLLSSNQSWDRANVILSGPIKLGVSDANAQITFATSAAFINGNGNTITIDSTNAYLNNGGLNCTLVDVTFDEVHSGLLRGTGTWNVTNVRFNANAQSITITGALDNDGTLDVLGLENGSATFNAEALITLNTNFNLGGTWILNNNVAINGNSNIFDLDSASLSLSGDIRLADVTLTNVNSSSFDNQDSDSLWLSNVMWIDPNNNAIRITGAPWQAYGAECWISDLNGAQGNIFNNEETWWYGTNIELLSDISLQGSWVAGEDDALNIDGKGHTLDLAGGTLIAADNSQLTLRNIVLANVDGNAFGDVSTTGGSFSLSNVTVKLSGNADFSDLYSRFVISGPVTFITDEYTFTVNDDSFIDGVTVFYDTLSMIDSNNVEGFDLSGDARLLFVTTPIHGDIVISSTGTTYLERTEYLSTTANDVAGRKIDVTANGSVLYDGVGRTLFFPTTTSAVFSVGNDSLITTENIVLEGLLPTHLSVDGSLSFGDGTVIRLMQDWAGDLALTSALTFGSSADAAEEMVLDLNGYMIDLADENARLELVNGTASQHALRICNGRLLNLTTSKLRAWTTNSKIILENVELVLSGSDTYTFGLDGDDNRIAVDFEIQGNCLVSGIAARAFNFTSTGDFTIASGAKLTLRDGIQYHHNGGGIDNFVMIDSSSCLELIGATFKSTNSSSLLLTTGTMTVDHKTTFDVGTNGITFDETLNVQIRPSATISVTGGGALSYSLIG
jgi:hypothetical protein